MKLLEQKKDKSVKIRWNKASKFCQLCNPNQSNLNVSKDSKEMCRKCGNKVSFTECLVQVSRN